MSEMRPRVRKIATDRRIWGGTLVLVGWTALGMLTQVDLVAESSTLLVYVYLLALSVFVQNLPGGPPFWVGFIVFCFGTATVLVYLFDRVRALRTATGNKEREPPK